MKCQNCGAEILDKVKFCPKCGTKVENPPVAQDSVNSIFPHSISSFWPEWQIEKQLGKGSYGVVYQAIRRDNNVESHAAIKIISIPTDASEVDSLRSEGLDLDGTRTYFKGVVDDFVSEIQLMESLKGIQNIVSVEDYKVVEKTDGIGWDIYIRMELLTPFNTYICDKTLTEAEVIKLGSDICTALEICGQRNIIHRDIKPENIFVNDFGYFKLGDFGIARKLENMTGGLSQKGTYNYMAPEVANSSEYDARVDTYSLGIVLYRLLNNNKLPFLDTEKQLLNPNERKNAVDRRMRGEELPAPCNASAEMANLILRACAYDPAARFASATEMKEALTSISSGSYKMVDTGLDRTTSVRRPQNPDATTAVRKPRKNEEKDAQPAVDTFGDTGKKKKGKKGKVIAITILVGVLALVIALAVMFFSSPAFGIYQDMDAENYTEALSDYHLEVEDNFIQELLLGVLLGDRANAIFADYDAGNTDYESAAAELSTLNKMGFEEAVEKHKEIMSNYANTTASQYESGELGYDVAMQILEMLKTDGCTDAPTLIEKITAVNNAADALEKADEHYEDGDYENAILEYSKVPETDANYEEAQSKLTLVYADYINATVATASKYNASGDYKKAVQQINTAYDILPNTVDTSALDTAKEENFTAYKTQIANEVADLTNDSNYADAFGVIDEAISFDDNEYFRNLRTSTEEQYVSSVSATIQKHLDNEDYISAKRVVENALTVLPGNTGLKDLKKDVEDSTPTYLLDVCTPYEKSGYTAYVNGENKTMSGQGYTNGFSFSGYKYDSKYAIFNIGGQYTELSFFIGHIDGEDMGYGKFKIYCDGVLSKEFTVNPDDLPKKFTLDLTGVKQLKIEMVEQETRYTGYLFANVAIK